MLRVTASPAPTSAGLDPAILDTVRRFWGFAELRPLQAEAIQAALQNRDSLVVLPTGGGKSLCYQTPAAVANRTDIVISPLISLMKDQVDALAACGYPAVAIHSGLSGEERREIRAAALAGRYRLIFVAPERVLSPWFLDLAARLDVQAFAIDEAHCISQWGHDFRPEYRRLAELRHHFPQAGINAYTATATTRVRGDILEQLGLRDPAVLIGAFDRPNLVYRVQSRTSLETQVLEAVQRHNGEAVIVYCISRAETERLSAFLRDRGVKAAPYHAGLDASQRTSTQEAFAREQIDVVVATVAFGMGIDRSNVRCVIHAAMPKSIEHYQQETGRAGRDGLEAECLLLYAPADFQRWQTILRNQAAAGEDGEAGDALESQAALLQEMQRYSAGAGCRHRALAAYFGQDYENERCGACDVCLNERQTLPGASDVARQVLSCIRGLGAAFGIGHVTDVLRGAKVEKITRFGHDSLAEYGALKQHDKAAVRNVLFQLVDLGYLDRSEGDRPVLRLTPSAGPVLSQSEEVNLRQPLAAPTAAAETDQWEGVDRDLFERLRDLRRSLAEERSVPAYVVFGDATLRELARRRPKHVNALRNIRGIGDKKREDLGEVFVAAIRDYLAAQPAG